MPANGNASNQYKLVTHLYQFFGILLGCSLEGTGVYPSYQGDASMYQVHRYGSLVALSIMMLTIFSRFMGFSYSETTYFIQQVGLAAESFGVADSDVTAVAGALNKFFNVRCEPPVTIAPVLGSQLMSICTDATCPLAPNATCSAYPAFYDPSPANATTGNNGTTSAGGNQNSTGSTNGTCSKCGGGSGSGSGPSPSASMPTSSNAESSMKISMTGFAGVLGIAVGLLL